MDRDRRSDGVGCISARPGGVASTWVPSTRKLFQNSQCLWERAGVRVFQRTTTTQYVRHLRPTFTSPCRRLPFIVVIMLVAVAAGSIGGRRRHTRHSPRVNPRHPDWRFGVVVKAAGGPSAASRATLPVPMDWPEQTVKKVGEEKTPNVGGVTLQNARRRREANDRHHSAAGGRQEASAVVTLEIVKRRIEPPGETSVYRVPPSRVASCASSFAESLHRKQRPEDRHAGRASFTADKPQAWDKAAAISTGCGQT